MSTQSSPWLVVVDLQRAFAEPGSPWYTPGVRSIVGIVADLVSRFESRVVFTRFVPPREPVGSWRTYYEKWRFALGTHESDIWSLIEPWRHARSISSHTFSKWVPELRELLGPEPSIVLCGISTDCCVLATAFAAVDGGADVRLVSDACIAKTPELHAAGMEMMRGRAPQLTVVTSKDGAEPELA